MKSEDILDVLVLVLALAILLSVGLGALARERDRTQSYKSEYIQDKNLKQAKITQDVFGDVMGEYSLDDVLLAFQIQNYYMQQPKKMGISLIATSNAHGVEVGKEVIFGPIEVTALFEGDRDIYISWVKKFLTTYVGGNINNLKFTLELDNGIDLMDTEDDFYVFKVVQ